MAKIKNLIVGCGFSGVTVARKIAEDFDEKVVVIDARDHIAGNCYDYWDGNRICVHKYGTHIFHTNLKEVWDFVSRFTKWYPYQHKVKGLIDGQLVPIPFNLNSLHQLFPESISSRIGLCLIEKFGVNKKVCILDLQKVKNKDLNFLAEYVYQKVFLEYTIKQWAMKLDEIDSSVLERVPVHISRDDRYFQDKYQGVPLEGYTKLISKMLDHSNIDVRLSTPFSKSMEYERLFYTGAIDEFFDYRFGQLPYRSIKLDFIEFPFSRFQDSAVINYPCNYDFTRIGEYKWFLNNQSDKTVVSYEYPESFVLGENERYYPIIKDKNVELYNRYLDLAKDIPNIYFLGRLGDYKYYDIDKAIERVIKVFGHKCIYSTKRIRYDGCRNTCK
ncbi:UDP-galactopyranose mutase [Endomicrobiia bacterium]|nr:UDP-galactopyranose mutase [Endomicrobiia bacterium]GHT68821.1 UDP-galactopyranose mutase [Endomicrobiia bacterium]